VGKDEKKVQAKGIGNIFNKVIAENFPNLEKEMAFQVQDNFRIPNTQSHNRTSPYHITAHIVKMLSIQSKEIILKAVREKNQVTTKAKPSE
jgi:hypothetical protein